MQTFKLSLDENELGTLFTALCTARDQAKAQALSHENETVRAIAEKQSAEMLNLLGKVANKLTKLNK